MPCITYQSSNGVPNANNLNPDICKTQLFLIISIPL